MAQTDLDAFLSLIVDVETESNALKGLLEAIANNEVNPMPDFTNSDVPVLPDILGDDLGDNIELCICECGHEHHRPKK